MFNNTTLYVSVLCELDITANQFLLCHLLYQDTLEAAISPRNKKAVSNLFRYSEKKERQWTKFEIDDLVDRGYLIDKSSRGKRSADLLEVTDKFISMVYAPPRRFQELWEIYPKTMPSFDGGSSHVKLKVCDPDELEETYNKLVKTNKLHDHIIDLTKWAIRNHQLNIGIANFVKSRHWETLEELRLKYAEDNMRVAQ